jgi:hypothetical protein
VLVVLLIVGASGCVGGDESSAVGSTEPDGTTSTTFGGITTTTVFEVLAADCDPFALAIASLSTISPTYSTVNSHGCDRTHAWAWMSRGDSAPDDLLSVLFEDVGGLWQAMDTVAACTTAAGSSIAADVLASGCAHL